MLTVCIMPYCTYIRVKYAILTSLLYGFLCFLLKYSQAGRQTVYGQSMVFMEISEPGHTVKLRK